MSHKFSQQQIISINYYYSKIVEGTFDEDDVRLLLIALREFIRNTDNKLMPKHQGAMLLCDIGDSLAHTIRNQSELHRRIRDLVMKMAAPGMDKWRELTFSLLDFADLLSALANILREANVLYNINNVESIFARNSEDLRICLVSMLHGLLFKIKYPGLPSDFYLGSDAECVYVKTEVDLSHVTSIRQLRLNASIPVHAGGWWQQCVLCCELEHPEKVSPSALNRTGSKEGYLEPVKALRREGRLTLTTISTDVPTMDIYHKFCAASYDTHPLSKGTLLTKIEIPIVPTL